MSDYSSYREALEAAGATVHVFEEFGSYQGDWVARVTLPDGRAGWIKDYFGSCSECDAFEDESRAWYDDNYERLPNYGELLAAFGRGYFDGLLTQEEVEKECARSADWSLEDGQMLAFVVKEGRPQ